MTVPRVCVKEGSLGGPLIVDLFAGPGGWDEGLAALGRRDVVGVEWDEAACLTAEAAGHRRVRADVAALDPVAFVQDAARMLGDATRRTVEGLIPHRRRVRRRRTPPPRAVAHPARSPLLNTRPPERPHPCPSAPPTTTEETTHE